MVNYRAGDTLQKAISEGRATRCSAKCKATGVQCKRVARNNYPTCSVHGSGTSIREVSGKRRPPGRPIKHGLYSTVLRADEMDLYDQAFGDLTLVHEAALSKVKLAKFIERMGEQLTACASDEEEDGQTELANAQPRANKKEDEYYYYVRMLDSVVRTVSAAYEQLRGKKIVVNFDESSDAVLAKSQEFIAAEIAFMTSQLCPECKRRVIDSLKERQQTVRG